MNIISANPDQSPEIHSFLRTCWEQTYIQRLGAISLQTLEDFFNSDFSIHRVEKRLRSSQGALVCTLAIDEENIIGLKWPFIDKSDRLRTGAIYVDNRYQGGGIGKSLQSTVDNELKSYNRDIYAVVEQSNQRAIHFIEQNDYEMTGNSEGIQLADSAVLVGVEMIQRQ